MDEYKNQIINLKKLQAKQLMAMKNQPQNKNANKIYQESTLQMKKQIEQLTSQHNKIKKQIIDKYLKQLEEKNAEMEELLKEKERQNE